jgi:hypothetical protein
MLRQTYDPKVTRELAVMKIIFPLIGLVICVAIERSVATIEAVWEQEVSRRGVTVITMADLSFSRTTPTGESLPCRYQFEIGTPSDGFKVGDKLDIVPATGTCQRADIIGRSEQNP